MPSLVRGCRSSLGSARSRRTGALFVLIQERLQKRLCREEGRKSFGRGRSSISMVDRHTRRFKTFHDSGRSRAGDVALKRSPPPIACPCEMRMKLLQRYFKAYDTSAATANNTTSKGKWPYIDDERKEHRGGGTMHPLSQGRRTPVNYYIVKSSASCGQI